MDKIKQIKIGTEYITLGQFLKFAHVIQNGGEAKLYLAGNEVRVNGEPDNRRGRKLRPGDRISLAEGEFCIVS
ncbi:MAG: S4 domain-containing protein YaaA [Bacilli bacterium]|nr:S4 domain-containing protein YaaA [Bacilli bacterium]